MSGDLPEQYNQEKDEQYYAEAAGEYMPGDAYDVTTGFPSAWQGLNRPSSAPAAIVNKKTNGYGKGTLDLSIDSNYFNYYYSQKPLDPRLPAPAFVNDLWKDQELGWESTFYDQNEMTEPTGQQRGSSLVDSIQRDFPRTPSNPMAASAPAARPSTSDSEYLRSMAARGSGQGVEVAPRAISRVDPNRFEMNPDPLDFSAADVMKTVEMGVQSIDLEGKRAGADAKNTIRGPVGDGEVPTEAGAIDADGAGEGSAAKIGKAPADGGNPHNPPNAWEKPLQDVSKRQGRVPDHAAAMSMRQQPKQQARQQGYPIFQNPNLSQGTADMNQMQGNAEYYQMFGGGVPSMPGNAWAMGRQPVMRGAGPVPERKRRGSGGALGIGGGDRDYQVDQSRMIYPQVPQVPQVYMPGQMQPGMSYPAAYNMPGYQQAGAADKNYVYKSPVQKMPQQQLPQHQQHMQRPQQPLQQYPGRQLLSQSVPGQQMHPQQQQQQQLAQKKEMAPENMAAHEAAAAAEGDADSSNEEQGGMGSASSSGRGDSKEQGKRRNRVRHDGVARSKLLEEFRTNKSKKYTLMDIKGNLVEFSGDQHGSRFIQQKLEVATAEEKDLVFDEIYPHVMQLMTDVFGNYVVQKMLQHGSPEHQLKLGNCLKGKVLHLSLQMYGCRVVQKAMDVIPVDLSVELAKELQNDVLSCVKDQNGNHVVQKCIEAIPPGRISFIIDPFIEKVSVLATHPYGCRVIQRLLENCNPDTIKGIVEKLLKSTLSLVQDQYGNYVVQHIMEYGTAQHKSQVVERLKGNALRLSTHKFASNVIEKCIEFGSDEDRRLITEEILDPGDITDKYKLPLMIMMKDQYANYVVQRMLDVSDKRTKERLLKQIRPLIPLLKKYTYGRHIINFLDRYKLSSGAEGTA